MTFDIRPLSRDDLPALSRFLTEGFHAPAGSAFATEAVLHWKYFDPRGAEAGDSPRSYLAVEPNSGRIVGHAGVCPGRFHGVGLPTDGIGTLHIIDWLTSESGRGVGTTLMRRVHQLAPMQYGIGASAQGRKVGTRIGYDLVQWVPVYQRVLRPRFFLRTPGYGLTGRWLRVAREVARRLARPPRASRAPIEPRRVEAFGDEVRPILDAYGRRALFTTRAPDLLNYFLRYPMGGLTGWHLVQGDTLRGFALLSLVTGAGGVRLGRVADCVLDTHDDETWHASAVALTQELRRQGADVAQAFASTDWAARAWRASGFAPAFEMGFNLRDRAGLVPRAAPFHLTSLEADYAYT